MANNKQPKVSPAVDNSHPPSLPDVAPSGRNRRFYRAVRLFAFAWLFLLTLVGILPNLIGWLGLHQPMIRYLFADRRDSIYVGSISLGWFQSVSAYDIRAVDERGQTLATIDALRTSRSLVGLIFNRTNLGEFYLVRPQVSVQLRDGGSNVEDALSHWFTAGPRSTATPQLTVYISDGRATLCGTLNEVVTLSGVGGQFTVRPDGHCAVSINSDVSADTHQGRFSIDVSLDSGNGTTLFQRGSMALKTSQLPLALIAPIAERWSANVSARGMVNADINLAFDTHDAVVRFAIGECRVAGLTMSCPQWFGNDQLVLKSLSANGRITLTPHEVVADRFELRADAGEVVANGQATWSEFLGLVSATAPSTPFQLEGRIDLAYLATMFKELSRLHQDVRLESGFLRFQVANRLVVEPTGESQQLAVALEFEPWVAVRRGQRLVWNQPLKVNGTLVRGQQWATLENISLQSDFLQISGRAHWNFANFRAQGDLRQLIDHLGQFFDMSQWKLAGRLHGDFGWRIGDLSPAGSPQAIDPESPLPIEIVGSLTIQEPVVAIPQVGTWGDRALEVSLQSRGSVGGGVYRIDQSRFVATVGDERLVMDLAVPVTWGSADSWHWQTEAHGSLNRWLTHLRAWMPIPELFCDAQLSANGRVIIGARQVAVDRLEYRLRLLALRGYGMHVQEQEVSGVGAMEWNRDERALRVRELTVVSSTVAARAKPLVVAWSPKFGLDGTVVFRADLERLLTWFGVKPAEGAILYSGQCEGALQFMPSHHETAVQLQLHSPEIVAAQRRQGEWLTLLRETSVELTARGAIDADWHRLRLDEARLRAPSLTVAASGQASDFASRFHVDVSGAWQPNWQRVAALVAAYTGDRVSLKGAEEQTFRMRGPLFATNGSDSSPTAWPPDDLEMIARLVWKEGEAYRLPIGPGTLTAKLERGVLLLDTGRVALSGGSVALAPKIDFRQREWVTVLEPNRFAREISITPEICRDWMRYFAPILADVTSTQGRFSMQTGGAIIPLSNPAQSSAQGAILLHDITVGPGPLGRQLIATVNQVRALIRAGDIGGTRDDVVWIRLKEQTVPFTLREGRIYHNNLEFTIQDFVVRTRGSVGLDQSLAIVAEIPIADHWIEGQPFLAFLKGRTLSLPIGGTLTQPRPDNDSLQQVLRQIVQPLATNPWQGILGGQVERMQEKANDELQRVQDQVRDKVEQELRRGLERLIKPRRDQ